MYQITAQFLCNLNNKVQFMGIFFTPSGRGIQPGVLIMSSIYVTPAAIGYLTQFILSSVITAYFLSRFRNRNAQLLLLTIFFCLITIFIGLLFWDAVLLPFPRLLIVYAENTILALAFIFLIQFAYQFPKSYPKRRCLAKISLIISSIYALCEASYMIYRYYNLLIKGIVYYRPPILDGMILIVLLLAPIAFLMQCITTDPRHISCFDKLMHPQGKDAKGARTFFFIFGFLLYLGIINYQRGAFVITTEIYNLSLSVGILFILCLFASNYINFMPGGVSVKTKWSFCR
jgi:hypothetical protein